MAERLIRRPSPNFVWTSGYKTLDKHNNQANVYFYKIILADSKQLGQTIYCYPTAC